MSQRRIKKHPPKQTSNTGKPTPRGLFQQAESFFQAAALLFHTATTPQFFRPQFTFPSMVCEALSAELYLKCLLVIEGKGYPATHNIEELFDQLKSTTQAEIERIAAPQLVFSQNAMAFVHAKENKPGPVPVVTFRHLLHHGRNAFETFRYIHEKSSMPDGVSSSRTIAASVREYLCVLHPGWRNFSFVNNPEPPSSTPTSPAP